MESTLETTALDHLDFSLDCESNIHEEDGYGNVVAIAIIHYPCCGYETEQQMCEGCIEFVSTYVGMGEHSRGKAPCEKTFSPFLSMLKHKVYL